jgi:hypothetical protein
MLPLLPKFLIRCRFPPPFLILIRRRFTSFSHSDFLSFSSSLSNLLPFFFSLYLSFSFKFFMVAFCLSNMLPFSFSFCTLLPLPLFSSLSIIVCRFPSLCLVGCHFLPLFASSFHSPSLIGFCFPSLCLIGCHSSPRFNSLPFSFCFSFAAVSPLYSY